MPENSIPRNQVNQRCSSNGCHDCKGCKGCAGCMSFLVGIIFIIVAVCFVWKYSIQSTMYRNLEMGIISQCSTISNEEGFTHCLSSNPYILKTSHRTLKQCATDLFQEGKVGDFFFCKSHPMMYKAKKMYKNLFNYANKTFYEENEANTKVPTKETDTDVSNLNNTIADVVNKIVEDNNQDNEVIPEPEWLAEENNSVNTEATDTEEPILNNNDNTVSDEDVVVEEENLATVDEKDSKYSLEALLEDYGIDPTEENINFIANKYGVSHYTGSELQKELIIEQMLKDETLNMQPVEE